MKEKTLKMMEVVKREIENAGEQPFALEFKVAPKCGVFARMVVEKTENEIEVIQFGFPNGEPGVLTRTKIIKDAPEESEEVIEE